MKRFLAVTLAAVLLFCFAGCQGALPEVPAGESIIVGEGTVLAQPVTSLPADGGETPPADSSLPVPPPTSESTSVVAPSQSQATPSVAQPTSASVSPNPSSLPASSAPGVVSGGVEGAVGEVRAVWISYLDLGGMLGGASAASFRRSIQSCFANVADLGLNTVIVQVRPFSDALYPSQYFSWSYLCAGTEGVGFSYDPLASMVEEAHTAGLSLHAWINPYRVRTSTGSGSKPLDPDSTISRWLDEGNDAAVRYNGGIYLNPGSEDARDLIVDGVREIVRNYAVDGIHFDDYFYPDPDESFDRAAYSDYQSAGGGRSLANWRRENNNALIKSTYDAIKAIDASVLFGVSPQGSETANYSAQYIDVDTWLANPGYVDYICPQLYWGFNHGTAAFDEVLTAWNNRIRATGIELWVGMAAYKIGTTDTYAGAGSREWINNSDILSREVLAARSAGKYNGFVLFRYASLFTPDAAVRQQVQAEKSALKEVL